MNKKVQLANRVYPWYAGLSSDLIFFIAINTIWLSTVKGFSPAEITFLTTVSSFASLIFQFPSLVVIKKLGNTNSIRIGSLLFLIASVMLTFCTKYISFMIADIFYEMAFVFTMMSSVILKNNLDYLNESASYVKIRSNSSLIYAISTAFITLSIGFIFNIYQYLPMILGIVTSVICLILSFFLFDIDEKVEVKPEELDEKRNFVLPKPVKLFLLIVIFYGVIFGVVVIGQQNSKLLIQKELLNFMSVTETATYIGIVMFISRLVRIVVNYYFPKMYKIFKDKMSVILAFVLLVALGLLLFGYYLNANIYIKITFMVMGFSFFPALRDPINIYIQNLLLEKFAKRYQNDTLIYLSFTKNFGKFILSGFASLILLKAPLHYLFISFACLTVLIIAQSIYITQELKNR